MKTGPDGMCLQIEIIADSHWVDGHFPGNPVLPGVALLECVSMVVTSWNEHSDCDLRIGEMSHVRFKAALRGASRIAVSIQQTATTDKWKWTIQDETTASDEEMVVAQGNMTLYSKKP
jgi:3-hydroxyacyl-[acyl-carrier-protein] dehydratase